MRGSRLSWGWLLGIMHWDPASEYTQIASPFFPYRVRGRPRTFQRGQPSPILWIPASAGMTGVAEMTLG